MENCTSDWKPFNKFLKDYYFPVLVIVGLVVNLFCILVFAKTRLNKMLSSRHLIILASVDSAALVLTAMFEFKLDHKIHCGIMTYLYYVASTMSTWCVVSFTVERFIAVYFPLK